MLEEVKTLLGIESDEKDELLESIIAIVTARLLLLLNAEEVPSQLEYIVQEVAVVRFNRIGSEGLKAHSIEGEKMDFGSSDFDPYVADIQRFNAQGGKVRFL